jgi:hypothetical protein
MKTVKHFVVGASVVIASLIGTDVSAQFWGPSGGGVKVCAAYGYGKFSGHNGKRPKFIAKGHSYRKAARSRKHFATRRRGGFSLVK